MLGELRRRERGAGEDGRWALQGRLKKRRERELARVREPPWPGLETRCSGCRGEAPGRREGRGGTLLTEPPKSPSTAPARPRACRATAGPAEGGLSQPRQSPPGEVGAPQNPRTAPPFPPYTDPGPGGLLPDSPSESFRQTGRRGPSAQHQPPPGSPARPTPRRRAPRHSPARPDTSQGNQQQLRGRRRQRRQEPNIQDGGSLGLTTATAGGGIRARSLARSLGDGRRTDGRELFFFFFF